ncbi:Uncharacterised protein [uncultured archaeon]|nr:Uncharacterised protein [uncultured archaeon]
MGALTATMRSTSTAATGSKGVALPLILSEMKPNSQRHPMSSPSNVQSGTTASFQSNAGLLSKSCLNARFGLVT